MRDVDIAVVGAGPAGTAAAITARRAGRSVVLIDKAEFPREKICGDGLTTTCLRLFEDLGLDPATVATWHRVDDVVIRSPSGRRVVLPLPRGRGEYAVIAERSDLDHAMVETAADAGAEVVQRDAVTSLDNSADRVVVGTETGLEYSAGYVIAADGMWSPTRKLLGIDVGRYLGEWHAFRQYFRNVATDTQPGLHVWFEPDVLPGYVWSFPLPDGRANVGYGILRNGAIATRDMGPLWADLLQRPHIRTVLGPDAEPESPHRAWPIPARIGHLPLTLGRTLFVGDAAALTDPMTGEGIAQALVSGQAAASAIVRWSDPVKIRHQYEKNVRHELALDHRFGRALGSVLRSTFGARGAVRVAGLTPWTSRHFARWLFEDYPRAVLATPSRWQRRMFRRPGAYRPHSSSSAA